MSLADYRGKVVLVNFWATWCAPCVAELPSMQKLRDKLSLSGFEVLAVNYKDSTKKIDDFLLKRPLDMTIPATPTAPSALHGASGLFRPASSSMQRGGFAIR